MSEEKKACEGTQCFCQGLGPQATAFVEHLWDQKTQDHFRNSRIEFLKGVRSLIDDKIARLSRTAPAKGSAIPVD